MKGDSKNIEAVREGTYNLLPNEEQVQHDADTMWVRPENWEALTLSEKVRALGPSNEEPYSVDERTVNEVVNQYQGFHMGRGRGGSRPVPIDGNRLLNQFKTEYLPLNKKENKTAEEQEEYDKMDSKFKALFEQGILSLDDKKKAQVNNDLINETSSTIEGNLALSEIIRGEGSMDGVKQILGDLKSYGDEANIEFNVASLFRDPELHAEHRSTTSKHGKGDAVDISSVTIGGQEVNWDNFASDPQYRYYYQQLTDSMREKGYRYINESERNHGHFEINPDKVGEIGNRRGVDVYSESNALYQPDEGDIREKGRIRIEGGLE